MTNLARFSLFSSAYLGVPLRLIPLLGLVIVLAGTALAQGPAGNNLPDEQPQALPVEQPVESQDNHHHAPLLRAEHQKFAEAIDLDAFRKLAVFHDGRVKILDTLAREAVTQVYGKPRWKDVSAATADLPPGQRDDVVYDPLFTYLDWVFSPGYYHDKPTFYVEVLPYRERLIAHLPEDERQRWKKLGRISVDMFTSPQVREILMATETDLNESKARNQLLGAVNVFATAGEQLQLISPHPGSDTWSQVAAAHDHGGAKAEGGNAVALLWGQLGEAWAHGEAESVNTILAELIRQIPQVHPATYPESTRLNLEYIYNRTGKFSIGYIFYGISAVLLILALVTARRWLFRIGHVFLIIGLIAHAASFTVRALLSDRWAIHNQYESFIAISLFAVVIGVVFMYWRRQWIFGAAAATLGAVCLLTANLWAIPSHQVGQVAGILDTSRILYVHVNMVLVSYSLIALAFFVSLVYLLAHYLPVRADGLASSAAGVGTAKSAGSAAVNSGGRKAMLHDLDRAQLVLMQLAFWLLGTGIMLGAYWADHAWGRWWAWDPKETWALITWIVYLIAIHTRLGVKNRGLVTAWLSVIGFVVMLWTYWGVNLLLSGLHSYA
jgi:cytochrome c-type biogenesis protein CcsB